MKYRTVIVGFGQIAQGYSKDPRMSRHFAYSTHAQVLRDHPSFDWEAVVDVSPAVLADAVSNWNVASTAGSVSDLPNADEIEVAVIATHPNVRTQILNALPSLKAVIVEKPLGSSLVEARKFLDICKSRKILVQVNLIRRADQSMRELASGRLTELIGTAQAGTIFYGNGLLNNGTHMIDLARMLLGEIESVSAMPAGPDFKEGPIDSDRNFALSLQMGAGQILTMQPLRFSRYRENSLDIWGEKGRLAIMQEGLAMLEYKLTENRSLEGSNELASESPILHTTGIGTALYDMYSNLSLCLGGEAELISSGESALVTSAVVQAAFDSLSDNGRSIHSKSLIAATHK